MIQGRSSFIYRLNKVISFGGEKSDSELSEIRNQVPPVFISKGVMDKTIGSGNEDKLPELIEIQREINNTLPNGVSVNYHIDEFTISKLNVDISLVKNDILDIKGLSSWSKGIEEARYILEEDGKYLCGWEVEKMSKSKYNVVNPDELVDRYGADTLRMYEMFLGPVEQSKPWNTNGIEGVWKFLRKFWGLFHDNNGNFAVSEDAATPAELKILHGTIKKIEDDVTRLSLNTSVSNFMIATNELNSIKSNKRAILEPFVILLAPYAPHIAEELWSLLGHTETVFDASFPVFDEQYLKEDSKEYPIMINGKMRAKISFASGTPNAEMEKGVLANELVQKWLEGKAPKKVIIVPDKIVNIVV